MVFCYSVDLNSDRSHYSALFRSSVDGYTRDDLNVLRTVRMISEYVQMATQTVSPRNLSFLENLEFIEGRSLVTCVLLSHNLPP